MAGAKLPNVAIVGATGGLGTHITAALLSPEFRSKFGKVIILSRQNSSQSETSGSLEPTYRKISDDSIGEALKDADILINTIGKKGHEFKEKILRALPETGVKLYFPSEFGVDHYLHDFSAPEWAPKKHHFELTKQLIPDVNVCRIYNGLFLEDSIGPWFGFDTKNKRYESIGSPDVPITFTSLPDVGRSVAALASFFPAKVPDQIHLNGSTDSMVGISKLMTSAGAREITITQLDLAEYRAAVLAAGKPGAEDYIRFVIGEGKCDHSGTGVGNDNELLNPGESGWKWKTLKDLADETSGTPWGDVIWP